MWSQYNQRMCLVFYVTFAVAHLSHNALLCPIGLSKSVDWMAFAWMGVFYSQSSLLATWAAFSEGPLLRRLPRAVFLVGALAIAATSGTQRNQSGMLDPSDLGAMFGPIVQFAVVFITLLAIRKRSRWSVSMAPPKDTDVTPRQLQFSMFDVLEWVSITSVLLSSVLLLVRKSTISLGPPFSEGVVGSSFLGALVGFVSLPIACSVVAMMLGASNRSRIAFWSLLLAGGVLGLLAILGGLTSFGIILSSFYLSFFGSSLGVTNRWVSRSTAQPINSECGLTPSSVGHRFNTHFR